jgi:hypothetical protein
MARYDDGQTTDVHSVSAGLDYPGVGPEHAYWKDNGRVEHVRIADAESLEAFQLLRLSSGQPLAIEPDYKKIFRAAVKARGRLQLLAAMILNLNITHSAFPWRKNLGIFVFKIRFEIFRRVATPCFTDICAMQNRKMGRKSVSPDHAVTYPIKNLTP